ncbi:hypothetical protein CKO45_02485 [Paracraurococcus ruber]|uniref:Uncharacterized protein n=3 Tax=Paracraurococcus ruber TaxID=77675 RepID=A0ABS1CSC8_9PROT|nr:hypothetical protein [Paracraurococcus ruber]
MFMKSLTLPVLAVALSAAGLPGKAEAYPQLLGGGRDAAVNYGTAIPGDTIVGGAAARIQGGGRDQTGYLALPGGQAREGRVGVLLGGGRDAAVQYLDGMPDRWAGTAADVDELGHGG